MRKLIETVEDTPLPERGKFRRSVKKFAAPEHIERPQLNRCISTALGPSAGRKTSESVPRVGLTGSRRLSEIVQLQTYLIAFKAAESPSNVAGATTPVPRIS